MQLKDSVLATISYYDALDFPLTHFDVWRYLVNPARLSGKTLSGIGEISLREILAELDDLKETGIVEEKNGFYFLKNKSGLVHKRTDKEKIGAQKWRRLRRYARWLQLSPWVRGIFVSGSLAMGNTNSESDYDVLVIMKSGRLYIGRLLLSGLTSLMGIRRTRYEKVAPDKFCFNHYLTDDNLKIGHPSLYNAQTYSHLVPLMIDERLAGRFFASNIWINQFLYNFSPWLHTEHREMRENRILKSLGGFFEHVLDKIGGNYFERTARSYQQRRIKDNPATYGSGGRVIFNDSELEFHPRSFERSVLDSYNALARRHAFSLTEEPDSGLFT